MKRRFLRIPIGIRLGLGVLLVQLLLIAWMTYDSREVALDALERQKNLRITELSSLLNDALAPLLVQRNYAALQDVLTNVGRTDGIVYLVLHDTRGVQVAAYGLDRQPTVENNSATTRTENARFDTRMPITLYGQEYGMLQLGISTAVFEQTRQHLLQRGLLNALVGTLLLLAIVLPVSFCLSRRLGKLSAVAGAIAGGELDRRLEDRSRDELGHLVDAFNHMANSLQDRMEELEQSGREREKVIEALAVANRDLQRLSEVAAHHMREPLRRLITYSQRLRQQCASFPDSEALMESLDVVEYQSRQMSDLVRDVERYLSAAYPQGEVQLVDVDIMARNLAERLCTATDIELAAITVDAMPAIRIDRPRMLELLEVLLDNALNHRSEERPFAMHIGAQTSNGYQYYRFSDNGRGIDADYRERVFTIFERLDRRTSGTGIGLAIARRIIESLNGHIWIEDSDFGEGVTVVVELPQE